MKKILLILLIMIPILVNANIIDDKCSNSVMWGAPKLQNDMQTQYLCRTAYAVNFNYKTKTPNYVVEHVIPVHLIKNVKRQNDFHDDTDIPIQYRSTLKDYLGSGFDRGHLASAADFTYDKNVMRESFLMSNMTAQNKNNNRGVWSLLEGNVRDLAKKSDIYVISGTIFFDGYKTIGKGVGVPNKIYKIILIDEKSILAYVFPNTKINSADIEKYRVSVADIEKLTGIDFFPSIPVNLKDLELHS